MVPELTPGDAAPVYLRVSYELDDGTLSEIRSKTTAWLGESLDRFPTEDARALARRFTHRLQQIEFGTRRQTCDWNYTILEEKDDPFSILLPDAQTLPAWGRLLAVKTRVEIASGHPEEAIKLIRTGIGFGRHVAGGPFYINRLVGFAMIATMLDRVDELIAQPGAPNLYWALTALPDPLLSMREATEREQASLGLMFTGQLLEEVDLTRPRSQAEWSSLLAGLHARMVRIDASYGTDQPATPKTLTGLAAFQAAMLRPARDYLKTRRITATSDDQALVLTIIGLYRELADDRFKLASIPYPAATAREAEVRQRELAAKSGPASSFVMMLANVQAASMADAKVSRKIAALRIIEALRLHAAAHDGQFPATLDEIKAVPIPLDPVTGKPFEYRLDRTTATLIGVSDLPPFRLAYRLTLRK